MKEVDEQKIQYYYNCGNVEVKGILVDAKSSKYMRIKKELIDDILHCSDEEVEFTGMFEVLE